MTIAANTTRKLITALADKDAANEIVTALNTSVVAYLTGSYVPAVITATAISATTDFGALVVGDKVVVVPAVAGNVIFYTVATAGTLPAAAVVGSLYVVLRAKPLAPAASTASY